jgi:hypothetical protein
MDVYDLLLFLYVPFIFRSCGCGCGRGKQNISFGRRQGVVQMSFLGAICLVIDTLMLSCVAICPVIDSS